MLSLAAVANIDNSLCSQRAEARTETPGFTLPHDASFLGRNRDLLILGDDPGYRRVGGAVQSRVFAVGTRLWAERALVASATQAIVDVATARKR